MAASVKKGVLFVCLGNICRSPMAEIIFKSMVKERELENHWFSDSAGTSAYHIGDSPDKRSIATCQNNLKYVYTNHRARQLMYEDFSTFSYIFCMDNDNLNKVKHLENGTSSVHISLLGEYDPLGRKIIEDPYYGGADGFTTNFNQITRSLEAFLQTHSHS